MKALVLILVAMISACVTAPDADSWPDDMPPRDFFVDHYEQDEAHQQALSESAYLTWIYRFYNGWELYSRGWIQATNELADSLVSPNDQARGRELMDEIGLLIAPDWAKSDPHRSINIRHVALWGNVILKSMVTDQQLFYLYQIRDDILQLLDGDLEPDDIKRSRYVAEESFVDFTEDDF